MTAPVQEGEVLAGKYQVERILGQGGMGVVVAAKHLQLEQKVALKFLLPEALSNQDAVIRFEREAKAAVKIQSEHVAKVLDVGKLESGAPYMVMEYLTGNDLADVLKVRGVPPVEEAVDWLLQACEAMAEAHSYRIIHRDLKPKNLFVIRRPDGSSALKVLDFGISKTSAPGSGEAAGLTNTTAIMGSPLYMSPEQLRSSRDVDPRTDLWSLGVILYEMLTGHPPFQAETMPQLCMAIVTDPPPPMRNRRPDLPDGLEEIVLRCLEKDPQNRYENVAQFARALAEFASSRGRTSAERIGRILQNTGNTDTDPIPASRNQGPFIPAGSTSTAWAESQRSKSNRAVKTNVPAPTAGEITAQNNSGSKSSMFIALGGVAALLAVGGVIFMNSQKSNAAPVPTAAVAAPPPTTPAAEPASNLIEIKISATPADAKIFLDDTPLSGNPASTKMKADGAAHQVRVEAAGHTTHRQLINYEKGKNIDLPVTLTEAAPANTKPAGRPGPNPGPGAPAKPGGKGTKIDTKDPYAQ